MKKLIPVILLLIATGANAQKVFTKNGHISFFSKTKMEDIKADNNQVMSVLNTQTGELLFTVLMKSFHFDKALMEEHFNENYVESEKFPKSTFKGTVTDISKVNFAVDGAYPVNVTGDLTLHGTTQKVTAVGKITVSGGKATGSAKFIIKLSDYKIEIPNLVKDNISNNMEITVQCVYDQKL